MYEKFHPRDSGDCEIFSVGRVLKIELNWFLFYYFYRPHSCLSYAISIFVFNIFRYLWFWQHKIANLASSIELRFNLLYFPNIVEPAYTSTSFFISFWSFDFNFKIHLSKLSLYVFAQSHRKKVICFEFLEIVLYIQHLRLSNTFLKWQFSLIHPICVALRRKCVTALFCIISNVNYSNETKYDIVIIFSALFEMETFSLGC